MTQTYRVLCLSEAISPITHMARTSGNEAIVARQPVLSPHGILWVPVLSGNALRHRLVREPGVRWLVEQYGLAGTLTLTQLNFLFHGGNLTEGGGREDTTRIATMQRLFPLLRLVGGSLPDQILAGSLLAGQGLLVCRENVQALTSLLPDGWELPETLRSAEEFVSGYQYTRGDARKSHTDLLAPVNGEASDSNLMIFSGQAIIRGAYFLHSFILQHVSELELGALLWSLRLWQFSGGTVGGQGARGHGRLQTWIHCGDADPEAATAAYRIHALSVRDEAVAWLDAAFARAMKAVKGKRAAKETQPT